jgi:hypothetical protein
MRPGTDQKDKHVVHMVDESGPRLDQVRALLEEEQPTENANSWALIAGYAAHVLTDVAWRAEIILPFRRPLVERMPYSELRTLYYNETDRLDFDLYDEQPWRPTVWEKLQAAQAQDVHLEGATLLTADEIDAWRVRTLGWFEAHREKANYTPQQITREGVWPFIPRTAARVAAQLAELGAQRLATYLAISRYAS